MIESKFIDSSLWLDYLFNGNHKDILEQYPLLMISTLSWFEIKKKLHKEKIDSQKISRSLQFIQKRSLFIPVTFEVAEKASQLSLQFELPAVDSLIYASALLQNAELLTKDNDFRTLKHAVVLS